MNAALVQSFDTPPRYADFSDPAPQPGELLVRVRAAALHPIVRALAAGKHYGSRAQFPFVAGLDGAGFLEDGSRVYFGATHPPYGAMAEFTLTTPERMLRLPDNLDDATAAALMNPAMSSAVALSERAHFQRGESVLIQGATGSAGRLAVQICKRRGAARIVATGRDPQALDELRALGADEVISLTQEHTALVAAFRGALSANKADIVLDYLWGAPAEALLDAIAQKGLDHQSRRVRYIQIGSAAGATIQFSAATLRSSDLEMLGSGFGSASIDRIFASLAVFLEEAARQPFQIRIQIAPLRDVEKLWNQKTDARLVFQP
jgi:NADPH:quinone reductase-like Zn-dependent oxidoreductase